MSQEIRGVLTRYLEKKKLKMTRQRQIILDVFLSLSNHATLEEIHKQVHKRDGGIGFATVYRTMKLFVEAGLATEQHFADGVSRYERKYNIQHHDHLICTKCGRVVEFENPEIERIQKEIAERYGFIIQSHRLEIYGVCSRDGVEGACPSALRVRRD